MADDVKKQVEVYGTVWTSTETITDASGRQWIRATRSPYPPVTATQLWIIAIALSPLCLGLAVIFAGVR